MEARVPIAIRSTKGMLYGTLHKARSDERPTVAIILASTGFRSRVGPHDLYVHIASGLCRPGCDVLRVDFGGLGESEGSLPDAPTAEVDRAIDQGMFAADVITAVDYMFERRQPNHIVLSGLCAAANTSLFAAAQDHRVRALILMGLPTLMVELPGADDEESPPAGQINFYMREYARKMTDPRSWLRLLTLRSNYSAIGRSLAEFLRGRRRKRTLALHARANLKAMDAFAECASRNMPILFVFGEGDIEFAHFKAEFLEGYLSQESRWKDAFDLIVVPHARHTFAGHAATGALIQTMRDWLARVSAAGWVRAREAERGIEATAPLA